MSPGEGASAKTAHEMPQATEPAIINIRPRLSPSIEPVPRRPDPVEIELPYRKILLARRHHCVLHVQPLGETLDRAPARVRVFDVGFLVQLEEFELAVRQPEELSPALPLQAEP